MPFKFHEPHRHRVPKARYRVRNWAEYDRGLVQRGDVRVWISAEALAHWKAACRSTPGGQRRFSNLAVETVLMLGALYKLPLRQTEVFVRSLIALMRLELTVPDHTTLARRRRTMQTTEFRWPRTKPVDIVIDSTGLKFHGAGESSGGNIRAVIADGAYDGEPTYDAIRAARPPGSPPKIVIPPKAPSIPDKGDPHGGSERKRHAAEIARHGRMAWQRRHGYGKRSLAETAFSRIKTINDGRLTSRTFGSQHNEIAVHIKIANRNMLIARPMSERVR